MTAHFLQPYHHLTVTGEFLRYQALHSSKFYYIILQPISIAECGGNTKFFSPKTPTKISSLGFMLHLSGSTDILGVIVKCMQEVRHHFKLAGEDVSRELGITNALRIKDATG